MTLARRGTKSNPCIIGEVIKDRGKGASKAAYTAILAVHRAKRALGYGPTGRVFEKLTYWERGFGQ